jgi:hypothetical protein
VTMPERDLLAIIAAHRRDALGVEDGDLSNQRATAMDHYHGRPYGNEEVGRSQVVSRDLSETVDWALPTILRAFMQSGNLGEFTPVGPEDEALAQQESDYVNQVLMKDNPGFMVMHDAIKDTMLLKNGYVKHFWEESEKITCEDYSGLTLDELTKMMTDLQNQGAEVEIKGQESKLVEIPGVGPVEVFDVKLYIKKKQGKLIWMAVPSEEVRVSKKCRGSLQESPFVEHVTKKTRSELIEMGMSRDFVDTLSAITGHENDSQRNSRDSLSDESDHEGGATNDRSMDEIEFCEAYVRVDYDKDGVAELRKVVTCDNKIPPGEDWNQQIEACALTGFVMKRVPHRHVGESFDDEIADLQEIMTVLKRQLLDNIYRVNNSEKVVNERVNLKDFMTSQPGGIKRVKGDGAVGDAWMPIVTPSIIGDILPVIDHITKSKEVRTGIRPGSDMDPDMLKEITKGAFLEHLNRASQKIEMITRMIAEMGVKEAVLQAHAILMRHQDKPRMVQLRGKWVPVNPQEWKERTDLTVRVGLGTGNEEEKRAKLMMLSQLQMQVLQAATQAPPQVYARLYALFEDTAEAMGVELPEKYALPPNGQEYQQMQQQMQEQAKNQPNPEMAKVQAQSQLEMQRMQMQQQTDNNRQQMEAQQQQAKLSMEMELQRAKAQMEMQLEEFRIQMKAQTDQLIAQMNNAAKLDVAQITAQTTLTTQQEAASDNAAQD